MSVIGLRGRSALFRLYHRTNYWGDPRTASGDSSRPERAAAARSLLQHIVDCNQYIKILDVGCGDFSWGSVLRLPPTCQYIGLDIVPEVIEANSRLYGSPPKLQFMVSDATVDTLPEADLILIRDLFIHLEDEEIQAVLRAVRGCKSSLLIASSYRGAVSARDLKKWNFAPIDLECNSYGLGSADFFIPEAPEYDRPEDGIKGIAGWRFSPKLDVDVVALPLAVGSKTPDASLPSTRLAGPPQSNWSICVDGRGFAFFSFQARQAGRPCVGEVKVRPLYASFSALDRRLTKETILTAHVAVMGRQCVVTIEEIGENCGNFKVGDLCLVQESLELGDPLKGSAQRSGYLCDSVLVDHSCLLQLPKTDKPYLFLLAYPLSCALSTRPLLESLEAVGFPLTAAVWGAGTAGLLMVELLGHRGWEVTISDIFVPQSQPAEVATCLGATYIQSDFNFEPEFTPLLAIDCSGDPSCTEYALRCVPQHGRVILWPEIALRRKDYQDDRLTILEVPSNGFLEEAIHVIQERFDGLMAHLIMDIAPLWEFDRALFPRVPNRTAVVKCLEDRERED
jgi:SAM-dependent methyltransferase